MSTDASSSEKKGGNPDGKQSGVRKTYDLVSETVARFTYKGQRLEIRDVYADTLDWEMAKIREVITTHKYVAMDTEFPGVVVRPVGAFLGTKEYKYKTFYKKSNFINADCHFQRKFPGF